MPKSTVCLAYEHNFPSCWALYENLEGAGERLWVLLFLQDIIEPPRANVFLRKTSLCIVLPRQIKISEGEGQSDIILRKDDEGSR